MSRKYVKIDEFTSLQQVQRERMHYKVLRKKMSLSSLY